MADLMNNKNLNNLSILLVEDNLANVLLLKEYLEETGINIIHNFNKSEILEIIKNRKVNLILMDIKLPGFCGMQLTKEIKILFPHIPVIAHTADVSKDDEFEFLNTGFDDFIFKPYTLSELYNVLEKYSAENHI
jgi:CheY-like chemotaxis protein